MHHNGLKPCRGASARQLAGRQQRPALVVVSVAAPDAPTPISENSGLKYLPEAARAKALDRKANKFEKVKVRGMGSNRDASAFQALGFVMWMTGGRPAPRQSAVYNRKGKARA